MFCASYNRTHKDKQMYSTAYSNSEYSGYMIKWSTDTKYDTYIEGMATSDDYYIYIIGTGYEQTAEGMWIASPSADGNNGVMGAFYNGYMDYSNCSTSPCGFRPIICLKSNVELEPNGSGGYRIK